MNFITRIIRIILILTLISIKKDKYILKSNTAGGLSKTDLELLKELAKIQIIPKIVPIELGIPFALSIAIGFFITLFIGDLSLVIYNGLTTVKLKLINNNGNLDNNRDNEDLNYKLNNNNNDNLIQTSFKANNVKTSLNFKKKILTKVIIEWSNNETNIIVKV